MRSAVPLLAGAPSGFQLAGAGPFAQLLLPPPPSQMFVALSAERAVVKIPKTKRSRIFMVCCHWHAGKPLVDQWGIFLTILCLGSRLNRLVFPILKKIAAVSRPLP